MVIRVVGIMNYACTNVMTCAAISVVVLVAGSYMRHSRLNMPVELVDSIIREGITTRLDQS